jgi:hypothetical protein
MKKMRFRPTNILIFIAIIFPFCYNLYADFTYPYSLEYVDTYENGNLFFDKKNNNIHNTLFYLVNTN